MYSKIINLIKQAITSNVDKDETSYPVVQVKYNGKNTYAIRLSSYGLCSNPPQNSDALVFTSNASEACKYAIIDNMPARFKNLKEGEVVLYNYLSKSYTYLKENGDIEIDCQNNMNITVNGDATVDVSGSLEATAGSSASVTAPTITLTGNVTVNGNFSVSSGYVSTMNGNLTLNTGTITAPEAIINSVTQSTHVHSDPQGGTTGGPQ